MLHIFPITENGEVTIIWASEETGYRHLYLITSLLPRPGVVNGFSNPFDSGDSNSYETNESKYLHIFFSHYSVRKTQFCTPNFFFVLFLTILRTKKLIFTLFSELVRQT